MVDDETVLDAISPVLTAKCHKIRSRKKRRSMTLKPYLYGRRNQPTYKMIHHFLLPLSV